MSKLVVIGDLHFQISNKCKYKQVLMFFDWLNKQEFNSEANDVLFLGDIAEFNTTYSICGELIGLFNKLKFNKIYVLQGNHDISVTESILNIFKDIDRVEVISDFTIKDFNNVHAMLCPYYHHEGKGLEPMNIYYSNLYKTLKDEHFDYCFHHLEDETNHFSDKYCDFSKLNIDYFLCGHIHTADVQKGGHYLGSPIKNSKVESRKETFIATIDTETKKYELINVPNFMDYYECNDKEIPEVDTPLALVTVRDMISKEESEKFYKPLEEKGIYVLSYLGKSLESDSDAKIDIEPTKSIAEYFDDYANSHKVDFEVADLCRETLKVGI